MHRKACPLSVVGLILLFSVVNAARMVIPHEAHAQVSNCPSSMAAYWKLEEKNAQESVVLALNAGGGAVTTGGITYQADSQYSPGGNLYTTAAGIAGTQDDALYQTERWGALSYNIPLSNGNYVVTFKFAEIYWTASAKRIFDVTMENQKVISGLDIYSKVAKDSAYDLDVPVTVADGTLSIRFTSIVDQPKLSALVIKRLSQSADPSATIFNDSFGSSDADCLQGGCPNQAAGKIGAGQELIGLLSTGAFASGSAFNWASNASFSIEFWMKKDLPCLGNTVDDNEVIVGRDSASSPLHWWVGVNCSGTSSQQNRLSFVLIDSSGKSATVSSTKVVSDGRWHHVVAQRDGANNINRIILDGQTEDETAPNEVTYSNGFSASDNPILTIGWLNLGGNFHYTGLLDELAIYNGVQTTQEVLADYYLVRDYCADCANPVRIMPLGDSITHGFSSGVPDNEEGLLIAYRKDLWDSLQLGGYYADFVGSLSSGYDYLNFDAAHEGHSGFAASEVAAQTFNWLSAQPPDVLLLHIGTNAVQTGTLSVDDILGEVDSYDEDIPVVLARIINRKCCLDKTPCPECQTTTTFNTNLQSLVNTRKAQGDKLILVDMEKGYGIDYASDLYDNLHPNASGYEKMAGVWFDALTTFMPTCNAAAPVITSSAPATATVGSQYVYTVQAAGNPAPTFALTTAPSGMTIDSVSGRITWTPTAAGSFGVTVRASNVNGATQQSFTVVVVAAATPTATTVHAINVGGPAFTDSTGVAYSADRNFTGGTTYSTTTAIGNTLDDTLYRSERFGNFSYALPVTNGRYTLTLKFAEIFWTAAAKRVFDVIVEGTEVVTNLDLYSRAGTFQALNLDIPVNVSDGVLNISFHTDVDNAKLSAIQVKPSGGTVPGTAPIHAINVGGAAFTDSTGVAYSADRNFSGGSTYSTTTAIGNTLDDTLYQSERFGNFSYALAVTNGSYTLILKFAEIYWTAANKRILDVSVEGAKVITGLDIYSKAGSYQLHNVEIPVTVNDGTLNISFQTVLDNAKLSAILLK